jgi:uncharacterized protein YggE
MLKKLFFILILFLFALLVMAALLKSENTQIMVEGTALVKARPDLAYLTLGVEQFDRSATLAQQNASSKMNRIISSLEKLGIGRDKMETAWVNLFPRYDYDQGKTKLSGYTANQQIKVTVEDLDKLGKVIDAVSLAGANNIGGLSFSIKDQSSYKKAALQNAYQEAQAKAQVLASAAGLNLSKIKQINEARAEIFPPLTAGVQALRVENETPIIPGNLEIRGNVTLLFEAIKK